MSNQASPTIADLPLPTNTYKGATLARGMHTFVMLCIAMLVFATALAIPVAENGSFFVSMVLSGVLWFIPALVISMFTRVFADVVCAIFDLRQIALRMATRMDEHFEAYWIGEDEPDA